MIYQHSGPKVQSAQAVIIWVALGLALVAALMYVLIALDVLDVGIEGASSNALVAWVMGSSGYLIGGLLILTRRRGLWITGAIINGLVLLLFLQKYLDAPQVMFSPGGLATKIPQLVLEVAMLYLIFATPHPPTRSNREK
jgi:hypothetical protein